MFVFRIDVGEFTADHLGDDFIGGELISSPCSDIGSVTHDGDVIGDALDFIHLVGDVDHSDALVPQIVHDLEQEFNFLIGKRRRRFVEDDHLRIMTDRLGDFHTLHLTDGQSAEQCLGIEVEAEFCQPFSGELIHLVVVNNLNRSVFLYREPSEVHVLSDASGRDRLKFLMHHGNSLFHCIIRVLDFGFYAVKVNLSFIHGIDSEEAFHQGGFSCTVLSHQGMN